LNTIFELWIECRSREARKCDQLRKNFEHGMHRASCEYVS
jgi:hypothetical protein